MLRNIYFHAIIVVSLVALATPGLGAESSQNSYSRWEADDSRMEKMVSELELVVDKASKARAADPNFLYDLKKIIQHYKIPRQTIHFFDDFSDGTISKNPAWIGNTQDFSVDRYRSLFSSVTVRRPLVQEGSGDGGALGRIIGILGEMALESQTQTGTDSEHDLNTYIYSTQTIPNNFIMEYTFRSETTRGDVNIGLFKGDGTDSGYKLKYHAGPSAKRPLQIIKYSRGLPYIVETAGADSPKLDDGRSHAIKWQRSFNGEMTVSIDGKTVIKATDLGYRQDFSGIVIANGGGTFSFDNIKVYTER